MTHTKRKTPGGNRGVEVSLHSDFVSKVATGQIKSGYVLEIVLPGTAQAEPRSFYVRSSKPAFSLLLLYLKKLGMTRAEALDQYFILSLTQHVHIMRKYWDLDVVTELIPPDNYARYHLPPLTIKIYQTGV